MSSPAVCRPRRAGCRTGCASWSSWATSHSNPTPSDRRATIAVITAQGRRVVDEITPAHRRDLRRLVFDQLRPDQVAALADAMATIAAHLKQVAADPAD